MGLYCGSGKVGYLTWIGINKSWFLARIRRTVYTRMVTEEHMAVCGVSFGVGWEV